VTRSLFVAAMLLAATVASPASAMTPWHEFVFFDEDSDELAPHGMAAIERAAAEYHRQRFQMFVRGYTDHTGSASYNQRLSELRAKIVADALAKLGVSRGDMVVSGRGENDNFVPTAPGVAEPFNRRVEITLQ
jgi:OmpA-OmpF porin, OOP family